MIDGEVLYLQSHFPNRMVEVRKLVEAVGERKFDPWTEIPGGPDFTVAEAQDFNHGN